ncbi:MAG: preprotein translocase subunit SecE [Candidatus Omnitrophica bacterium]|nr:preprotein translocase subunit SecE [Candidatus Omnitrophota bacterium]
MFGKINKFISEVTVELKKVAWTTRQELIDATVLVLISTGILGVFLWIGDTLCAQFLRLIIR